ncbi:uncharacterized protein ISCGN_018623 [Ixodes scapularis]
MVSMGTQTSPDDLHLPSRSPSKPPGAAPVAPFPNRKVNAALPASTPEQEMMSPAQPAASTSRGRGLPPHTSAPQRKPGEVPKQSTSKGQLPATADEPMDEGGSRSDEEALLSRSESTPSASGDSNRRQNNPPQKTKCTADRNDAPAAVSNNLNVVIDGHEASALVDTGADYSVLSGRLSRRLRKVTTPWDGPQIRTAGGHLITPVGRCTARVEIHGETCPVKFVVLQDCSRDVILGMDFLCEYGAVIDLGANQLTLRKPVLPPVETNTTSNAIRVIADHVNLPPRSSVFVTVITDTAMHGEALLEGSVQLLLEKGIGVARGVTDLQEGRTTVLVTNFREEPQHLTKGTTVGHIEEFQAPAVVTAVSEETSSAQQNSTPPPPIDINPELPAPKRRQLVDLLAEYNLSFRSPSTLSITFVNGSRASSVGRPEPSGAGHPVRRTSPTTHVLGNSSGDPSDRGGGHHVYVRSVGCSTGRLRGPTSREWCVSAKGQCTAVCEENLKEMDDNATLAIEFELPFGDLTPTEREMLLRTLPLWCGLLAQGE